MRLGLTTTTVGGMINIFDSEQRRFVTGGITVDASKVTAVNGVKLLKAGQVMGKNGSSHKYEPVTDKVAAKLLTGVVGSMAGLEVIRALVPFGTPSTGKLMVLDLLGNRFRTLAVPRDEACPIALAPA